MRQLSDAKRLIGMCLTLITVGCGTQAAPLHPLAEPATAPALAAEFDAASTGTIRGQVVWSGTLPESHSFREFKPVAADEARQYDKLNPCLPRINPLGNGVAGAIVYLRRVEPARSKPWDFPGVRIIMKGELIHIEQGGRQEKTGITHVGAAVDMTSENANQEMLRAQGAAFFTLPFPEPGKMLQRNFSRVGFVELSSGAGHFLGRAWLAVAEHPYYVRTDENGGFVLSQVPEGSYELVCWLPNWNVERFDRDPEVLGVSRIRFRPPMEKTLPVRVQRGASVEVKFSPGSGDFQK